MNSTNNTPLKIFLTGATGYIGGTALTKLLDSSRKSKYDITILTRSEDTIPKFKELGVTPLIGDNNSTEILTQAAKDADVVMHFANSADDLPSVKALIQGLNTNDGKRRIYIHTSGTSVISDKALGSYASDKIYSDLDMESIHGLPITQPHKDVDAYVFENSKNFDSIIVCPPTIYGEGAGPFKRRSIQIPALIEGFIKAEKVGTLGKGLNIWSDIHADDLGNFYALLLEKALEGKASTGKDGWYFCENGEHVWGDVVKKIAEALYKYGAIKNADLTEWPQEDWNTFIGDWAWHSLASNARSKADRARQLGWKPDEKNPKVLDTLEEEVRVILEKQKK